MLAALTWFLWPDAHWSVHPDALGMFIVTFLAWIAATFLGQSGSISRPPDVHPHDVELLAQFNTMLPPVQRQFLREHNFGSAYNRTNVSGLLEFADAWEGADFEFH